MFTFEPGVAVWSLVAFFIVLVVVARFVYPPIRKILDTRRETIAKTIQETEERLAEAQERARELEQRMHQIRTEETRILSEARNRARELFETQRKATVDELRELRKSREQDLRDMERGFLESSERHFSQIVLNTCEKILRTELSSEMQQKILEQRIAEFERVTRL